MLNVMMWSLRKWHQAFGCTCRCRVPSAASVKRSEQTSGRRLGVQGHGFAAALQDEPLRTKRRRTTVEQLDPFPGNAGAIPTIQRLLAGNLVAAVRRTLLSGKRTLRKSRR